MEIEEGPSSLKAPLGSACLPLSLGSRHLWPPGPHLPLNSRLLALIFNSGVTFRRPGTLGIQSNHERQYSQWLKSHTLESGILELNPSPTTYILCDLV